MADVKWIKITTDVFDDEKILMIESLPSADSIIVIWFKLLTFAGKQNNDGVFLMSNRIAYTDEMLASIFRRDANTVRMALNTFEQFGMIEIVDDVITIPNWGKHQTLDSYEKKKERDRLYQRERRANQRALIEKSSDSQPTQSSDIAISDKEIEKEKEEEKDVLPKGNTKAKPSKQKHGEFQNVLLTEAEHQNLVAAFGSDLTQEAIDFLDAYIEEKGYKSKSHNLAIRRWVIDAVKDRKSQTQPKQTKKSRYDFEALQRMALDSVNAVQIKGNPELEKEAAELKKVLQENY
jgi:predicted phage replisome organizer